MRLATSVPQLNCYRSEDYHYETRTSHEDGNSRSLPSMISSLGDSNVLSILRTIFPLHSAKSRHQGIESPLWTAAFDLDTFVLLSQL